ncbi:MAG: NAD(P)H-quinone oxidoreductase subunit L [Cyanobacteria bacterium]|nr:NAD(P)H-quinone oxidoreductase subunit L [Cyanobacteriota bacterium]
MLSPITAALPFELPFQLSGETVLVLALYVALAGAYLVVVPLALYWWMVRRWTLMGKIERTAVYGLVFLFFPGLILFAPFINLRMAGQGASRA